MNLQTDPLGPLWPALSPDRREFIIDFANSMVALAQFGDRDVDDGDIAGSLATLRAVRGEARGGAAIAEETEVAIIRRLMRAIAAGTAPAEVDRPEARHHTRCVHLVAALARDSDDIPGAVRQFATLLHSKVEPPFDLERVIADATEQVTEADK